jgi:hypothetical protein
MLTHIFNIISYSTLLLILPYQATASIQYLYPTVYIAALEAESNNKSDQDELFLEVIEYDNEKSTVREIRIPEFPRYWQAKDLAKITDLPIWRGILKVKESISLQIIFKDQDFWSDDDVIGSIKLTLYWDEYSIKSKWKIINNQSITNISSSEPENLQKLKLLSNKSTYRLEIAITTSKIFPSKKTQRTTNIWPVLFPRSYNGIFIQ